VAGQGQGAPGVSAFVVAALPGILAYIASRTVLASALVTAAPLYFAVAAFNAGSGRTPHMPAIWIDRAIPVAPAWVFVYASLSISILLPLFVVRDRALLVRALKAYLFVWIIGLAGFLAFPTIAPRPVSVAADGFAAWCLRLTYSLDTRYNCFPSLHVAQTFVAALTCSRVHRNLGIAAVLWAVLVSVSTLFTKQHYFVDIIAGALMAAIAYLLFLRGFPRAAVSEDDRRLAPRRALGGAAVFVAALGAFYVFYASGGRDPESATSVAVPATARQTVP
jgi:membrane-associated phospholipid phosphatase